MEIYYSHISDNSVNGATHTTSIAWPSSNLSVTIITITSMLKVRCETRNGNAEYQPSGKRKFYEKKSDNNQKLLKFWRPGKKVWRNQH